MPDAPGREATTGLTTVIIFTPHMSQLAEFYRLALELGPPRQQGDRHLGFHLPPVYLGFDQTAEEAFNRPGAVTVWFEVADLPLTYERCLALGATTRYPPQEKPWGARLASVYDPEGNLFGLAQRSAARLPGASKAP